jgi:hypothetical protein
MKVPDRGGKVEGCAHDSHGSFRVEHIVGINPAVTAQVNDSSADVPPAQKVVNVFDVGLDTSLGRRKDSEL